MSDRDHDEVIQNAYPDDFSHCYGCGRLNEQGLHLKSRVRGEEVVAEVEPRPRYIGVPGFVYGGLIAALIDCHAMAAAAAAVYRRERRAPGSEPRLRFVTARLCVDYLKPTPMGPLRLRARALEVGERKVRVEVDLDAGTQTTAHGEVLAVRIPETMRYG